MSIPCQLVLQALRQFAPPQLALDKDPTGLQVGHTNKDVSKVLCCLDLTKDVAQEAADQNVDLIISHHAVIFRPLKNLRTDQVRGQILEILIKNDIAVYVPHTALDVTIGGLNDQLAKACGLNETKPLKTTYTKSALLLRVLFANAQQKDDIIHELKAKDALYFTPSDWVIESIVDRKQGDALYQKLSQLDIESCQLLPLNSSRQEWGIGRIGKFDQEKSIETLANELKTALGAPIAKIVAKDIKTPIKKCAVLCGDGRSFIDAACFSGTDVFVTGDIDHHSALEANARGLNIIDMGHWATEACVGELLRSALISRLGKEDVEIIASQVSTQPFIYI